MCKVCVYDVCWFTCPACQMDGVIAWLWEVGLHVWPVKWDVSSTPCCKRESQCDISHSGACMLTSNIKEVLVFLLLLLLLLTAWRCLVMRAFHIPFPLVCGFCCHFQNHEQALTALLETCEFLAVTVQKHGFNDETWFILYVLSLNRSGLWALSIDFALHNYLNSKKDEVAVYLNAESF